MEADPWAMLNRLPVSPGQPALDLRSQKSFLHRREQNQNTDLLAQGKNRVHESKP